MERIKVGWRNPDPHHVQSAVSELEMNEEFTPKDIHKPKGLDSNTTVSSLMNMHCLERLGNGRYEKIFDPRTLLTNRHPEPLPEVCAKCYFTQESTSGPRRTGCIILADYRIKILSGG